MNKTEVWWKKRDREQRKSENSQTVLFSSHPALNFALKTCKPKLLYKSITEVNYTVSINLVICYMLT